MEGAFMKRNLLTLLLGMSVLSMASAQEAAESIPILNPQCDFDVLPCAPGGGCYAPGGITGWIIGTNTAVNKAGTTQFLSAPPEGVYVCAVGNGSVGSILQNLGVPLRANTTYILRMSLGGRADSIPFTGYTAALMAGNIVLASDGSRSPAPGYFTDEVITYTSGQHPPQLGKPLQIFVISKGTGQVSVNNVSLTAQATSSQ
jgi:hypothetical protein